MEGLSRYVRSLREILRAVGRILTEILGSSRRLTLVV